MKQEDIIKFIKSQRLRWVAHVMRMENTRTTRKITEWKPYKTRPIGRPRLRWMDQVEEDLRRMKITGWRVKIEDRQVWDRIVEQTNRIIIIYIYINIHVSYTSRKWFSQVP